MTHKNPKHNRPEWAPADADESFASHVMAGVEGGHDGLPALQNAARTSGSPRRRQLSVDDYVAGVRAGDRTILARTITLIESNAPAHLDIAQEVLRRLLPATGESIRVGITGVPGVGKSSFIESFGMLLCERGHHVAVLAVDPSSSITRGSILGDKTRMELLSREPNAFIRPSPSSGTLGGVARKSRETMLVCEAAGFDIILVETIGVGQSEITVRSMVDFFLLLMLSGAGDELQGIKKGVIELADALVVNKADGDNKRKAQVARAEYARALHFLAAATEGWRTRAQTCSAMTGEGVPEIWDLISEFQAQMTESGMFERRRRAQARDWMHSMVEQQLQAYFYNHPTVSALLPQIERQVADGELPATTAARQLLQGFEADERAD